MLGLVLAPELLRLVHTTSSVLPPLVDLLCYNSVLAAKEWECLFLCSKRSLYDSFAI